jgi:hypothetical protein
MDYDTIKDILTLLLGPAAVFVAHWAVIKDKISDHHKTLYGNGKPGVVTEINTMRSDIRSLLENCEKTHSEESKRLEENAQRAAEVIAAATLKAAHEVADEAVRAALRRDNTARETARVLAEAHAHDTI